MEEVPNNANTVDNQQDHSVANNKVKTANDVSFGPGAVDFLSDIPDNFHRQNRNQERRCSFQGSEYDSEDLHAEEQDSPLHDRASQLSSSKEAVNLNVAFMSKLSLESEDDILPRNNALSCSDDGAFQSASPKFPMRENPEGQSGRSIAVNIGMYNWQASKKSVHERFTFLFNNEMLSDVTFIVSKGLPSEQHIPAHKLVLSAGSAVFDAMFNSNLAVTSNEIDLPDVEPAAFLNLLRFLYSDEVQIGPESVISTLYTAKKYAVPALESHCVDFLKQNLGSDNAFILLSQARLFDEPQLASLCLEMIDKNTPDTLNADGFTDIDLQTLCSVLERPTLCIKESTLFQAVLRWSVEECQRQNIPVTPENQRKVFGPALNLIRFPLMTLDEFANEVANTGILTDRESLNMFLYFTANPKPDVHFLDVSRCCVSSDIGQVVNRFMQIDSRWGYSGTSDRIRFMVDRRIFVLGFGLYGSVHVTCEYKVHMQISSTGSGRIAGTCDTAFTSDGSSSTFKVMFKEPVEIQPNIHYTAAARLKGADSHYGTRGLRKVVLDCPSGGKICFVFSFASGSNNGTSVDDGQIPEIYYHVA